MGKIINLSKIFDACGAYREMWKYINSGVLNIFMIISPPCGLGEMLKKKYIGSFPSSRLFSPNCSEIYSYDSGENKYEKLC